MRRRPERFLLRGQRDADKLLIIASVYAFVRECRMAPTDRPAEDRKRRLHDLRPADFLIALRTQVCEDQIARFRENHKSINILDEECGPVIHPLSRRLVSADDLPLTLPTA